MKKKKIRKELKSEVWNEKAKEITRTREKKDRNEGRDRKKDELTGK